MGYDLIGTKPANKKGIYFRNNIWWWHHLAEFVLNHVELPKKETQYWHSNNGQKVRKASADKIAKFLFAACKNTRKYSRWKKDYFVAADKMLAAMKFPIEGEKYWAWKNVKDFATFCKHSGGFRIC